MWEGRPGCSAEQARFAEEWTASCDLTAPVVVYKDWLGKFPGPQNYTISTLGYSQHLVFCKNLSMQRHLLTEEKHGYTPTFCSSHRQPF